MGTQITSKIAYDQWESNGWELGVPIFPGNPLDYWIIHVELA